MTILAIGNRTSSGFTLFEIMVSVAVLSIGLVFIYEALLGCLGTFTYYVNYLNVQCWMNEKIWLIEDELIRSDAQELDRAQGKFMSGAKNIDWRVSVTTIVEGSLYELNLVCSWQEGPRDISVSRVAYAGI